VGGTLFLIREILLDDEAREEDRQDRRDRKLRPTKDTSNHLRKDNSGMGRIPFYKRGIIPRFKKGPIQRKSGATGAGEKLNETSSKTTNQRNV